MQLAAYVATIDDKEAMGLGEFPDDKVLPISRWNFELRK
jgi:hypothetical protein